MKYLIRLIASPFVFGLIFISYNLSVFKRTILFVRYGGEFINYGFNEGQTIQEIYEQLANKEKEVKSKNENRPNVYTHNDCVFNYCPHPDFCKKSEKGCSNV